MKYVEVSETVFRDLLNCKSQVEDIKEVLLLNAPVSKMKLVENLFRIVYSKRYQDDE